MSDTAFIAALAVGMGSTIAAVATWYRSRPTVRIRDADGERTLDHVDAPISQRNQHHA